MAFFEGNQKKVCPAQPQIIISRPAEYFIACYTVLNDPTRLKQLSTVAIVGFQFGLYHVIAPLSFLRSISLASFCYSVYFWLIRSFTDPAFTGSIFVCGPLHHHVLLSNFKTVSPQIIQTLKIFTISLLLFKMGKHSNLHLSFFQIVGA